MIRKAEVLSLAPKPPQNSGRAITAQAIGPVLILNCYQDKELLGRWCMDTDTGRYLVWLANMGYWEERRLQTVYGHSASVWSDWNWYKGKEGTVFDSQGDEAVARELLGAVRGRDEDTFREIGNREKDYNRDRRERAEDRKAEKLRKLMDSVPPLPERFARWIHQAAGGEDYLFHASGRDRWVCTACGGVHARKNLEKKEGDIRCPSCGKTVRHMGRRRVARRQVHAIVLQDLGDNESVARHIDVLFTWDNTGRHTVVSEGVRLVMRRKYRSRPCHIYYSQAKKTQWRGSCFKEINPANRQMTPGYLYPEGIEEALAGTGYQIWTRVFREAADKSLRADYNLAMCASHDEDFVHTCEYLIKGRFLRLAAESFDRISVYSPKDYAAPLNKYGRTIEEVFGIRDRQKINRIRDMDGGGKTVEWLRWSEEREKKLGQEFLEWAQENEIGPRDLALAGETPEKGMNYIRRQKRESYPDRTERQTLEQWQDYLDMCQKLGKDLSDPLISRPRELKRRHDEAVEETRKLWELRAMERNQENAERIERRMRERYPGAEENLREVRAKFEYESGDYRILVPGRLSEIAMEGYALHHCVSASDRYYERIMRHETYICFLRRVSAPETPYYTIEVEPGGTIRQHRSYCDKEPGIEELRGFLKEWQRVIQSRMKEEDHRRASISRQLREENIQRLKEDNNTRVLRGLMEDFMEAI